MLVLPAIKQNIFPQKSEIDSCLGDRIKLCATTCENKTGGADHE